MLCLTLISHQVYANLLESSTGVAGNAGSEREGDYVFCSKMCEKVPLSPVI